MAALPKTFDRLFDSPDLFDHAPPTYDLIVARATPANTGQSGDELLLTIASNAIQPLVLAYVDAFDPGHISFIHSAKTYPGSLAAPTPHDGIVIATAGRDLEGAVPVPLSPEQTERIGPNRAYSTIGATHAALAARTPGQHHLAVIGDTVPGSTESRVRRTVIMPCEWAGEAIRLGRVSLLEFYDAFIQPLMGTARITAYAVVTHWWRHACTSEAAPAGAPALTMPTLGTQFQPIVPNSMRIMKPWYRAGLKAYLDRLPLPATDPVTGTDFNAAVAGIRTDMADESALVRAEAAARRVMRVNP